MTITRKRAFSVALGSGVAAMSAAACQSASATAPEAHAASKPRAVVRHAHAKPRRGHARTSRGEYVYKVIVGGVVSTDKANAACSGSSLRLTGMATYPESKNATALWERSPAAWRQRFAITTSASTTITVSWSDETQRREANEDGGEIRHSRGLTGTAPASRVCAATKPNAALGSVGEGVVTWRLPKPAKSVAALLAQPVASIYPNQYVLAFEISPDGTVPAFAPFNS